MVAREEIKGNWNELQGRIKEKWGQLTDDELRQARGNRDQLIGLIQRKTGEAREQITKFFDTLNDDGNKVQDTLGQAVSQATEAAQQYAAQAQEYVHEGYQQAARSVHEGVQQAEQLVRTRPVESLAVVFGAGIMTGLLAGLVMRSK